MELTSAEAEVMLRAARMAGHAALAAMVERSREVSFEQHWSAVGSLA